MEDVAGRAGVLSVEDWTLAPDGRQYRYFWCGKWVKAKDGSMCAIHDGAAVVIIAEENARSWCLSVDPVMAADCYTVKAT